MPEIQMKEIRSSNLAAAGYDPDAKILRIKFQSGREYEYFDVSQDVYDMLWQVASAGSYFAANIKNRFRFLPV
jgi:hypothetical protein